VQGGKCVSRLFGTDGVRGVANKELTGELCYKLGAAGGLALGRAVVGKRPKIFIGMDTRVSGALLSDALAAGALSVGCDVVRLGVVPTPGVAFLVRALGATAGVVVSASHNSFEYNGVKFFSGDGFKLADALEDEIEGIIKNGQDGGEHITGALVGREEWAEEGVLSLYADFLAGSAEGDLSGLKVAVDCANGAASDIAKKVFAALGVNAVYMGDAPDGVNINEGCGSTNMEALQKFVVSEGADIGIAFDGDADRMLAVDETGALLDGDKLMFVYAKAAKEAGALEGNLLTATVMSNAGFEEAILKEGIELQRADVGDRYVLEMMQKTGSVLGGEQSGHIIFLNENTTGDGIFAGVRLLSALAKSGGKASGLAAGVQIYPQVLKNAKVKNENKYGYAKDEKIAAAIAEIEAEMSGHGRVLIRPSGTEPLVRVMLEGEDLSVLEEKAAGLVRLLEERLK